MTTLPVAEHILRLRPYLPGKPIEEVQRELGLTDIIKLASNENPLGPSPRAVAAMTQAAGSVTMYPEGSAPLLREAVSRHAQMPPETLVFGNGSDEVLHLLALSFLRRWRRGGAGRPVVRDVRDLHDPVRRDARSRSR